MSNKFAEFICKKKVIKNTKLIQNIKGGMGELKKLHALNTCPHPSLWIKYIPSVIEKNDKLSV